MVVTTEHIELSREEIVERLEESARRYGMSAGQLVRKYLDGTLEDPGAVADVLALASLLDDEDELFEGRRIA
jgi:hypothetical protein